jgi:spore coat polysaccharide biosynthesis predicted glycosyltransferase SpsG
MSHAAAFVDSYLIGSSTIEVAARQAPVAVTRDFGEAPVGVALVLDPAYRIASARPAVRTALRVSRPVLLDTAPPAPARRGGDVLISTGSVDPAACAPLVAAVQAELPEAEIELVRDPHADREAPEGGRAIVEPGENMLEALIGADLAVTGGGQTMLEACAVRVPSLAAALVDNQSRNVAALERRGAVVAIDPSDPEAVARTIRALAADVTARAAISRAAQGAVDGGGAARVAAELEKLSR